MGVTVLTSMNDKDLVEAGYASGVETTVVHRARQAKSRGLAGLVLSPREVRMVRGVVGTASSSSRRASGRKAPARVIRSA